nr:hypothetical protein [Mycobacterium deserti]
MKSTSEWSNANREAHSRLVYIAATHCLRAAGDGSMAASWSGKAPCIQR